MRVLVVLLLLANAGFFAWSHWIAGPVPGQQSQTESAPRIVLAGEAPVAQPPHTPRLEAGVSCLSLGPFFDLSEAARASTSLRASGLEPRQRATVGAVWTGWWIALEGIGSQEEAAPVVERLRQFGVGDAYVVPGEEGGVIISLGLFTERQRALRRGDEVRALGYEPALSERQRNGTMYWIDVNVHSAQQVPDPADFEGLIRVRRRHPRRRTRMRQAAVNSTAARHCGVSPGGCRHAPG